MENLVKHYLLNPEMMRYAMRLKYSTRDDLQLQLILNFIYKFSDNPVVMRAWSGLTASTVHFMGITNAMLEEAEKNLPMGYERDEIVLMAKEAVTTKERECLMVYPLYKNYHCVYYFGNSYEKISSY